MRYFIHLAYHGAAYRGWQRQAGVESVQAVLEDALAQVLGQAIAVTACGRTDAGVHARQFIVHADIDGALPEQCVFRINKTLTDDIAVYNIFPVAEHAHARYDAVSRSYDYFIHRYPDPFLHQHSSLYEIEDLDVKAMARAVALLPAHENYACLCKKPDTHNTTLCTIAEAALYVSPDQQLLRFHVQANRFLMGMIRVLVHELLLIGQGELSLEQFTSYLRAETAPKQLRLAYPQGLHLSRIVYPEIDIPVRTPLPSFLGTGEQWQLLEVE